MTTFIRKHYRQSGYKIEFLAQKMGVPRMTFYHKRKNAGFSVEEMEKLFDIINVEHIEDKALHHNIFCFIIYIMLSYEFGYLLSYTVSFI